MKDLQEKLEKSVGKRLFVELYKLSPCEQKEYLRKKTYMKKGETCKYTKNAINRRLCIISKLKRLGLMQDILFDIYFRSKRVDLKTRRKAKKYYDELRLKDNKS